jgi:cytochrome P450
MITAGMDTTAITVEWAMAELINVRILACKPDKIKDK